jgi:hypothetical protein
MEEINTGLGYETLNICYSHNGVEHNMVGINTGPETRDPVNDRTS